MKNPWVARGVNGRTVTKGGVSTRDDSFHSVEIEKMGYNPEFAPMEARVRENDADLLPLDEVWATAKRLTACANACEGVEDPEDAVRALVEAARTAALFIHGDYEGRLPEGDVIDELRKALARFPKKAA